MTTDKLTAAVAHNKRITPPTAPWNTCDLGGGRGPVLTDSAIATILNAVASGALVPAADVQGLVEALTPSGDTKAAYMGEIKDPETKRLVSWTAIKMIMAMISARAAIKEDQ